MNMNSSVELDNQTAKQRQESIIEFWTGYSRLFSFNIFPA